MYSRQAVRKDRLFFFRVVPMLRAVCAVRDEVLKRCGPQSIDLENITKVFTAMTTVDHVVFVRYDTSPENPILGEFTRWSRQPGVYRGSETIVEIRYASHMSEDWRRFVVCKELCHSLDVSDGSCDVSHRAMLNLVDAFSLISAGSIGKISPPLLSELVAQAGALELLCPLEQRKRIVQETGVPNDDRIAVIATDFNLPAEQLRTAFLPETIQAIEWLINNH